MSEIIIGAADATPCEVNYNVEALDRLDNHFRRLRQRQSIMSASYALAKDNKIFACRSMGPLCGFEDRGALHPTSIRRIASVSKVFTAACIMKMVENGDLHLFQNVGEIIKEFDTAYHRSINIFHLLTHTSGLPADAGYFLEPYQNAQKYLEQDDLIRAILSGPLQTKPGKKWSYCSMGYIILGEIVKHISGTDVEHYATENIFKPLEMERTFYTVPDEYQDQVCLVSPGDQKRMVEKDNERYNRLKPVGGLYSTLYDLQKYCLMLLNKGMYNGKVIFGRKTVEMMTANHLEKTPAYCWGAKYSAYQMGLGWRITLRYTLASPGTYAHEGAGRCAVYVDPVEKFSAVFFVPTTLGWVPEAIINTLDIIWSGIL